MSRRLFVPAPPNKWFRNAVAGGNYSSSYAYIIGYYRAAETLVTSTEKTGSKDTLFFPICFNYRHYVELALKHLVVESERFYNSLENIGEVRGELRESVQTHLTSEHSLERLFNWVNERLRLVSDEEFDNNVRRTINTFAIFKTRLLVEGND